MEITVYNPDCDSINIYFQQYSETQNDYTTLQVLPAGRNSEIIYKICPQTRIEQLQWRVRISRWEEYEPACSGAWIEGTTQFSGQVDLTQCCDCPAELSADWFTLSLEPSPNCPDSGCLVIHHLNIPENITCYKNFEYSRGNETFFGEMTQDFINTFTFCLSRGQETHISLSLKRSPSDENPCVLEASVSCDTTPYVPPLKEPCTPDCYETPFVEIDNLTFSPPTCPGCSVTVYYTWRKACGVYQDLQILNILLNSSNCKDCPIDIIYKYAIAEIIHQNRMNFEPVSKDTCFDIWRIVQGGCWARWEYLYYGGGGGETAPFYKIITVWEPCDSSLCCLERLRVCRFEDGISINRISSYNQVDTCNDVYTITKYGDSVKCTPHCDWIANLDGFYPFNPNPIILQVQSEEALDLIFKDYIGIKVVNTNQEIIVWSRTNINSEITIEVRDVLGSLCKTISYKAKPWENMKNIDISSLSNGIYFYLIYLNNKVHISKAFSIIR